MDSGSGGSQAEPADGFWFRRFASRTGRWILVPAVREQNRPMGRVDSPALRVPRAKSGAAEVCARPVGCSHLGTLGKKSSPCDPGGQGTVIADGEYSRHRKRQPSLVGLAAAVCGSSADMHDDSRARRLNEARIHGRGLPAWYGGAALKAPQKRRDGSACEGRPEKPSVMATARPRWSGPKPIEDNHGSPHA